MIYKKLNRRQWTIGLSTALFLSLMYLSLNFNYLSSFIDEKGDCLTYDYYVRLGIPQFLFNPHHIGFDWAGEKFYHALKGNGYTGSSMAALQMRNLIVSSFSLGVIFLLFYKISKKYLLSLLIVVTYSFTAAYWIYSQINDTPIIHSVMVFILFLLSLYFPQAKHKAGYAAFLGLFHALTIFFHQSDLIMAAVIFFIMLFSSLFPLEETQKKKFEGKNIFYFLLYGVTLTSIVVIAYYYVGIILIGLTFDKSNAQSFNNIKDSTYFFNWLILYAKIDYWGKGFENNSNLFPQVITGISTYFYQPHAFKGHAIQYNYHNFWDAVHLLPNLIGALFFSVFGGSLLFLKGMYQKYRYVLFAVFIYMVSYSMLTCWWEADYREFWVAPLFSFWFLTLLFFQYIVDKAKIFRPLAQLTLYTFLFLLAGSLFYFNFTGFILPNAGDTYRTYDITR